ncbi:MAG: P-type conjugative transfer protein TrbL [Lachnospiraceae bacterium]|nr:P-type conjugative transfer protein TrbL [Desulfovibrio sp.]MBR4605817.1 P-type conjugative transfer protein TrbL [Lachnospiraceae bacterium]
MRARAVLIFCFVSALVMLYLALPDLSFAEDGGADGVLDSVATSFKTSSKAWAAPLVSAATKLFWGLASISIVWTFFPLLFRSPDFGSAFAELLRYMVFIGFFYWILANGPDIARTIITGMTSIGSDVGGVSYTSPSTIVDMGHDVFSEAIKEPISLDNFGEGLIRYLIGIAILVVCAICAVKVLLEYISCWILAYAGVFFLGFGATKWTSDMAIGYFKTVLGTATSLMSMYLLLGVANSLFQSTMTAAQAGGFSWDLMLEALLISICLLALVGKVPGMLQSIISGGGAGGSAWSGFGAGAAFSATTTAMRSATEALKNTYKTMQTTKNVASGVGSNLVGAGLLGAAMYTVARDGINSIRGVSESAQGEGSQNKASAREDEINSKISQNAPDAKNRENTDTRSQETTEAQSVSENAAQDADTDTAKTTETSETATTDGKKEQTNDKATPDAQAAQKKSLKQKTLNSVRAYGEKSALGRLATAIKGQNHVDDGTKTDAVADTANLKDPEFKKVVTSVVEGILAQQMNQAASTAAQGVQNQASSTTGKTQASTPKADAQNSQSSASPTKTSATTSSATKATATGTPENSSTIPDAKVTPNANVANNLAGSVQKAASKPNTTAQSATSAQPTPQAKPSTTATQNVAAASRPQQTRRVSTETSRRVSTTRDKRE